MGVDPNMRHVEEIPLGPDSAEEASSPTEGHRPHALTPRDEERRVEFQIGGTEQVFVNEDHGHGDDPIGDDDREDRQRPAP